MIKLDSDFKIYGVGFLVTLGLFSLGAGIVHLMNTYVIVEHIVKSAFVGGMFAFASYSFGGLIKASQNLKQLQEEREQRKVDLAMRKLGGDDSAQLVTK